MCKMSTYLELRRSRWLEKLAHMNNRKFPRLLLGAWINKSRRNEKAGRSQHAIRHAYVSILQKLGYTDKKLTFNIWMTDVRNRNISSKRVENFLSLPEGSYARKNARHQAAELRFFSD